LRKWITAVLAVTVIGLTTAFLFVSMNERGLVERPAPPGARGLGMPLRLPDLDPSGGGKGNVDVQDTAVGTPGALVEEEVAAPAEEDPPKSGWVAVEPEPLLPATEAGVRSGAESRVAALRACWPSSLPRVAGGRVVAVVYLTVSSTGKGEGTITEVSSEPGGDDTPMEACMRAAVSDLRFESPSAPLQVEYSILLGVKGE
jgi:hypothetical protein